MNTTPAARIAVNRSSIIASQQAEIDQMKGKLQQLNSG